MILVEEKHLTKLFDPIKIGHLEIKNRIAFAPTGMGTAGPNGSITDQTICHYSARAKGGAGLIIIEHSLCTLKHWKAEVPILSFHSSSPMVWMKDLVDAIHYSGAKAVVQLSLGLGRQSSPRVTGTDLVAPSSLPYFVPEGSTPRGLNHFEGMRGATPRELTTEEVMEQEGTILPEAEAIKEVVDIPVICPNIHDPLLAEKVVQENRVDVVSLSRGLLADPEWPNKAQEGRVDEIRHCVFCYNCLKSLWNGLGTRCSVNTEVGRERFIAKYQPFERSV